VKDFDNIPPSRLLSKNQNFVFSLVEMKISKNLTKNPI
jgi:hypothetical protein